MTVKHARLSRGIQLAFCAVTLAAGNAVMAAENHQEAHAAAPHVAAAAPHGGPGGPHAGPGGFGGPGGPHAGPGGPHGGFGHGGGDHYAFHGHDVHHFGHDDMVRWRGGRWNQTCFNGRCGWWWLAGGQWYFYATPVYPYPLVVSDVAYVEPVAAPAVVVAAPAPMAVAPAPRPHYYCDNPPGYYPAVQNCATQFRQVN